LKKYGFLLFGLSVSQLALAQTQTQTQTQRPDTTLSSDKNIRNKVLSDIQDNLDKKTARIDQTLSRLDDKVDSLDVAIAATRDAREKADKLLLRVQALEQKQQAIEENELNVYQANYQSAIINLVSMDKEIQPLLLFNSAKNFFSTLNETADPMNYPGYQDWYKKFYAYIEKEKDKDPALDVLHDMVRISGNITSATPIAGPVCQALFLGIDNYITSLGSRRKELRDESQKMFLLTAKLSQFDYDKDLIEQQWEIVTDDLDRLQIHYDTILNQNLALLKVPREEYARHFTRETDADQRYQFLTELRKRASGLVTDRRTADIKNWKQPIYYELMDVQSLKLRFGELTFEIRGIIGRYNELVMKYKNDPEIGLKVQALGVKLDAMSDTFDSAFDPTEYINSATRMYLVN
jgi:predicted ribosome quality control (RQC) complex YloA/Tae2 family protein